MARTSARLDDLAEPGTLRFSAMASQRKAAGERGSSWDSVMTPEPGDIIATGTPAGVRMAHDPQVWLRDGDVVEIGIDEIGTLRSPVRA